MKKAKKKVENAKVILMDIPWDCLYGRQVRRGVYHYAWPNHLWTFPNLQSYSDGKKLLRNPETVGIISMQSPEACAIDARQHGLALVKVGGRIPTGTSPGLAYAGVAPKAIGEMAVEHFLERGFHNFGMVGSEKIGSSKHSHAMHRGNAFVTALRQKGLKCSVFDLKMKYPSCGKPLPTLAWVSEQIRRWLTTLPKPLALFCVNDYVGLWVCELCRRAGIHIPEKVAVLGVDDDDMFCNMVYPHLSSIAVPAEQVGYEAAKMMDDIICDPRTAKRPTLLNPLGVVMRHSTDIMAIDDRDVIKAVRFIRENAHKGINVTSVMAKMRLPRRMLERRFKKALGRSPFAEIRRLQIERIKMILAQTNTAIEDIAIDCGFKSVTRMTLAFKRAAGIPPGKYRRLFQKK